MLPIFSIEDVERGAELSFSGPRPLRGHCIIVNFFFQTTKFWFQTGQTDRRNEYVLGLPCFKKLNSELQI